MRYFQYLTWDAIADAMTYTTRSVLYMHGRALLDFEKLMNGNERKDEACD